MPKEQRRLRVIAGPNGSGKSTLYNLVSKQVQMGEYVNADDAILFPSWIIDYLLLQLPGKMLQEVIFKRL